MMVRGRLDLELWCWWLASQSFSFLCQGRVRRSPPSGKTCLKLHLLHLHLWLHLWYLNFWLLLHLCLRFSSQQDPRSLRFTLEVREELHSAGR